MSDEMVTCKCYACGEGWKLHKDLLKAMGHGTVCHVFKKPFLLEIKDGIEIDGEIRMECDVSHDLCPKCAVWAIKKTVSELDYDKIDNKDNPRLIGDDDV